MSEKIVNAIAEFLRAEVALCERSQQLGVFRRIEHQDAIRIFIRAAEEIESLHSRLALIDHD